MFHQIYSQQKSHITISFGEIRAEPWNHGTEASAARDTWGIEELVGAVEESQSTRPERKPDGSKMTGQIPARKMRF